MIGPVEIGRGIALASQRMFPEVAERPQVAAARRAFAVLAATRADFRPLRRISLRADASWRPTYARKGLRP